MDMRAKRLAVLAAASAMAAVAGCATVEETAIVNGATVPRPTLQFTGQPYSIEHYHAHPAPGGPSDGLVADGGWIGGQVCRNSVLYFVEHHGEHVLLEGFVDGRGGDWLVVRDEHGERNVTGPFGEVHFNTATVTGKVNDRVLKLVRHGDRLVGTLAERRVVIGGADALWEMPAADQAVVFEQLLGCGKDALPLRRRGVNPLDDQPLLVGIGGDATHFPIDD